MKIQLSRILVSPSHMIEAQIPHPDALIFILTFLSNFAPTWRHMSGWLFYICQRYPSSMTTRENKSEELLHSHPRVNQSGDSIYTYT